MAERTRINRRHLTRRIAGEFEEIVRELLKLTGFRVTDDFPSRNLSMK